MNDALRDRYGRTPFGAGCLLARRLVEAGATFAEVTLGGWDSHFDADGRAPVERPITLPDLLVTVYAAMGLDPRRERLTPQGRPVTLIEAGEKVPELLG